VLYVKWARGEIARGSANKMAHRAADASNQEIKIRINIDISAFDR